MSRSAGERGLCGADDEVRLSRAALHYWEEPPISGEAGSGALFFTHCALGCIYCQNASIARGDWGKAVTVDRLAAIMGELAEAGAMNINCVTPTHYADAVGRAVALARSQGMDLPVLWNTGGYETVDAIRKNHDVVNVYLTDFKYADVDLARAYSKAPDYPEVALVALDAMVEEAGEVRFDRFNGIERLVGGVVVRHLLLPGGLENARAVVRLIHERYGSAVRLSLMNQYTPVLASRAESGDEEAAAALLRHPELGRTVPEEDYEQLLDYADDLGVTDYYWQQGGACDESFIPAFDLTGL